MQEQKLGRQFFALNSNTAANKVAAAITNANSDAINYIASVEIASRQLEAAEAVGMARMLIKKARGQAAHESRGEDDVRIDTEGALAELLVANLLSPVGARMSPLVAFKPDTVGVDLVLGGKSFDVKSVPAKYSNVAINAQTHDFKRSDGYVLVHIVCSTVADIYYVPYAAVAGWPLVQSIKGKKLDYKRWFYLRALPAVEPLPDFWVRAS